MECSKCFLLFFCFLLLLREAFVASSSIYKGEASLKCGFLSLSARLSRIREVRMREGIPFYVYIQSYATSCDHMNCTFDCNRYPPKNFSFIAEVLDSENQDVGVSCEVRKSISGRAFPATCIAENSYADLNNFSYSLRIWAIDSQQVRGKMQSATAAVSFESGLVSPRNCGPMSLLEGSNKVRAGISSNFQWVLRDAYGNAKNKTTGSVPEYSVLSTFTYTFEPLNELANETFRLDEDSGYVYFSFIPKRVGNWSFTVQGAASGDSSNIQGSPFYFFVAAGPIYAPNCLVSWENSTDTFHVGDLAVLNVLLRDIWNNSITEAIERMNFLDFNVTILRYKGILYNTNMSLISEKNTSHEVISFNVTTVGDFFLHVELNGSRIQGSPFSFRVLAGSVPLSEDEVYWMYGNSLFQQGEMANLIVLRKDFFNGQTNLTNQNQTLKAFTAYYKDTLNQKEFINVESIADVNYGYQILSFRSRKMGKFSLHIESNGTELSGSPLPFEIIRGFVASSSNYTGEASLKCGFLFLGTRLTRIREVRMREGIPFYFYIQSYATSCDQINCPSDCNRYPPNNFSFIAEVLGSENQDAGVTCEVRKSISGGAFPVACTAENSYANVNNFSYSLRIWAIDSRKVGGEIKRARTAVRFESGLVSPRSCGPMSLLEGSNKARAGISSNFQWILRDAYGNVKNKTTGSIPEDSVRSTFTYTFEPLNELANDTFRLDEDSGYVYFSFIPKRVGNWSFTVQGAASGDSSNIQGSPFYFLVAAGPIYAPNCIASWENSTDIFHVGDLAVLNVLLSDTWNNSITEIIERMNFLDFNVTILHYKGTLYSTNMSLISEKNASHEVISFNVTTVGDFFLHVEHNGSHIQGSPFSFRVLAGSVPLSEDEVYWMYGNSLFHQGEMANLIVLRKDFFNGQTNLTNQNQTLKAFTAYYEDTLNQKEFINVESIADVNYGYQILSFSSRKLGNFSLHIESNGTEPAGSPLPFEIITAAVAPGNCIGYWRDGLNALEVATQAMLQVSLIDSLNFSINASTVSTETLVFKVYSTDSEGKANVLGVKIETEEDSGNILIIFHTTEVSGNFSLYVMLTGVNIKGSPFSFSQVPGPINYHASIGTLLNQTMKFVAGDQLVIQVLPKDVYGNNLLPVMAWSALTFQIAFINGNGKLLGETSAELVPQKGTNYGMITFVVTNIGNYTMQIGSLQAEIQNSPFAVEVVSGPISVLNCKGIWSDGIASFQSGNYVHLKVLLSDAYNNIITLKTGRDAFFNFMVQVDGNNFTPNATMTFDEESGYEIISFLAAIAGNFLLHIGDVNKEIIGSPFNFTVVPGSLAVSQCRGEWLNNHTVFVSGQKVFFRIKAFDSYSNMLLVTPQNVANFTVVVTFGNNVIANSTAQLIVTPQVDTSYYIISFIGVSMGSFFLHVGNGTSKIQGSPFPFNIGEGPLSLINSKGWWLDGVSQFKAGQQVNLQLLLRDTYHNNFSLASATDLHKYISFYVMDSAGVKQTVSFNYTQGKYFLIIASFNANLAGELFLYAGYNGTNIQGVPFSYTVTPGPISISSCFAKWAYNVNFFQMYGEAKLYLYQRDRYSNPVAPLHNFQAILYQDGLTSPASMPDLSIVPEPGGEVGTQVLTFTAMAIGSFSLYIQDSLGKNIKSTPYSLTVFEGDVDSNRTNIYGAGISIAYVGKTSTLHVQLSDTFGNPTKSHPRSLTAILAPRNPSIEPSISSQYIPGVYHDIRRAHYGVTFSHYVQILENKSQISSVGSEVTGKVGLYQINYTPESVGNKNLYILWTNVILNTYLIYVYPGDVVVNKSSVSGEGTNEHIRVDLWNSIRILLNDSYGNLIPNQSSSLTMTVSGSGKCDQQEILEIDSGVYYSAYKPYVIGNYALSIKYKGRMLPKCPFNVQAHSAGYFPEAFDDMATTTENNIIFIDVLANDFVESGSKMISAISLNPTHGVALIIESMVMYSPKDGFLGNDTFKYILVDYKGTTDVGMVYIRVLARLPKLELHQSIIDGFEDRPLKSNRNSTWIEINSRSPSIILTAKFYALHGHVYLDASGDQIWNSIHLTTSWIKAVTNDGVLSLTGKVDSINSILHELQYIGDYYYNGNDTIKIVLEDEFGRNVQGNISLMLRPINSYPYISAPAQMFMRMSSSNEYGKGNVYEIQNSIVVGDPDSEDFKDEIQVMTLQITLEVDTGNLMMELPLSIAASTQIKSLDSEKWERIEVPLYSNEYLNISGRSIKFQASIDYCNSVLNSIHYIGTKVGAILSINVNDLGSWGCFADCVDDTIFPLQVDAKVKLVDENYKQNSKKGYIARVVGGTLGGVILLSIGLIALLCLVLIMISIYNTKLQSTELAQNYEESNFWHSRYFNPFWIPSSNGDSSELFSSTPNPRTWDSRILRLRKMFSFIKAKDNGIDRKKKDELVLENKKD